MSTDMTIQEVRRVLEQRRQEREALGIVVAGALGAAIVALVILGLW